MNRRQLLQSGLVSFWFAAWRHAQALSLEQVTQSDVAAGFKAALSQGASEAVAFLGKTDGFWAHPQVRIPLPEKLQEIAGLLRTLGQSARVDELEISMNRAAEVAVPLGKNLLQGAIKSMTFQDARKILSAGETSVTQFFAEKTREPLSGLFLPVVVRTTEKVGLARQYNRVVERASFLGFNSLERIEPYVTGKTLDGLYHVIGEEERKIRQNPKEAASAMARKIFGAFQ